MDERLDRNERGIDSLRSRMDSDARFRRAISGYDPQDVRAYVENVKRIFSQQAMAAKQEQEYLIAQLDSAKSELQARNCGVKKLKDLLLERESQLNTANTRINTLLQAVKSHGTEREELERLRQEIITNGSAERLQALERETQQQRAAVAQATSLVETWKAERERLLVENDHLRQEVAYLRSIAARPAPEQEPARVYASAAPVAAPMPVRQPYPDVIAAESRFVPPPAAQQVAAPQPAASQQKDFAQIADRLATMFAEAYQLVSQFRTAQEPQPEPQPQRPAQPYMQILRPEGVGMDNVYTRK